MIRYRLFQGQLREHPGGDWVQYAEAEAVRACCAWAADEIERLRAVVEEKDHDISRLSLQHNRNHAEIERLRRFLPELRCT